MQTETMKEYISYQIGAIMLYSSFQQTNFMFLLSHISAFNTLMTVVELTKIIICQTIA